MSETQQFFATQTMRIKASPGDIWAIWADINGWPHWDDGLESTKFTEAFRAGSRYELTPRGGDALTVTLESVTQGEEFTDMAVLPFGKIRTAHRLKPINGSVEVTHEIKADINSQEAGFFAEEIWPHMRDGLPEALANIRRIIED